MNGLGHVRTALWVIGGTRVIMLSVEDFELERCDWICAMRGHTGLCMGSKARIMETRRWFRRVLGALYASRRGGGG